MSVISFSLTKYRAIWFIFVTLIAEKALLVAWNAFFNSYSFFLFGRADSIAQVFQTFICSWGQSLLTCGYRL
jgi:hypothetical protein